MPKGSKRTVLFIYSFALLVTLFFSNVHGAELKPVGNVKANQGGTLNMLFSSEPSTLNPFYSDSYTAEVAGYVIDTLLSRNLDTYEYEPSLAESWAESKDGKRITFTLRKGAQFSDGTPVTTKDVKFSFDAIRDPKNKAASLMPYFENIKEAKIIDDHKIEFIISKKYFGNLSVLGDTFPILNSKFYTKVRNKEIQGSGPYKLKEYKKGRYILLERHKEWWGYKVPHLKGKFNFDQIRIRFVKEENKQLEYLKRGKADFLDMTPEVYIQKAKGSPFGKTIVKKQVSNKAPKGYGFIAWNFKNDLFKERETRVALAHLMNRRLLITKFLFEMSRPATGPWYQDSPYASPHVKPIEFDVKKANELLKKVGWADSDKDGVLDRMIGGKKVKFEFTLVNPNKDFEKYLTVYKEDLKKAGIIMNLKLIEWNSFVKLLDEKKFEAMVLAWSAGSVDNDPKQIWHSESIPSGSNFISYSSPEVDKLIDEGRAELDKSKRIKLYQKIYEKIAYDAPYLFLFNRKFDFYAYNKRISPAKEIIMYDGNLGRDFMYLTKPE